MCAEEIENTQLAKAPPIRLIDINVFQIKDPNDNLFVTIFDYGLLFRTYWNSYIASKIETNVSQ